MLQLLVALLALAQTDPGPWRAAWGHAQARAEIRARYQHREIDAQTCLRELAAHATPQEEAEMRAVLARWHRTLEARHREALEKLKAADAEAKRRGWGQPQPAAPPIK